MNNKLSVVFKKCILWVTGYLSIVAYVISGGYFFFKDENQDVTDSCKEVFVLTAIFTGLNVFNTLILNFVDLAGGSIGFNKYMLVVDAIKIVVFVIFFVLDLLGISVFKKQVLAVTTEKEVIENVEETVIDSTDVEKDNNETDSKEDQDEESKEVEE